MIFIILINNNELKQETLLISVVDEANKLNMIIYYSEAEFFQKYCCTLGQLLTKVINKKETQKTSNFINWFSTDFDCSR